MIGETWGEIVGHAFDTQMRAYERDAVSIYGGSRALSLAEREGGPFAKYLNRANFAGFRDVGNSVLTKSAVFDTIQGTSRKEGMS